MDDEFIEADHELEISLYDHEEATVWSFRPVAFDGRPDTHEVCVALRELADRLEFEMIINEVGDTP